MRLKYIKHGIYGEDQTFDRVDANILTQVALHLSVILATLPCAKAFFVVFEGGVFRSPNVSRPATRESFGEFRRQAEETQRGKPTWDRRQTFAKSTSTPQIQLMAKQQQKQKSVRLMPLS